MPQDPVDPPLFELDPSLLSAEQQARAEAKRPAALVHALTPEFQGLDESDILTAGFHDLDETEFEDIPEDVVARASAEDLRENLYWRYKRIGRRDEPEVNSMSYPTPEGDYQSVALTPKEYDTLSESLTKLGERVYNRVLARRDEKLSRETGDKNARARGPEDIREANRGAVRAIMSRQAAMEKLLQEKVIPKIELIERFLEMTEGKNVNLARGTRETVSSRFEELRTTVFDDMLDAVAVTRGWSEEMTARAKRVIQKRMYISGELKDRVANFKEMLALAQEYYGCKRALILTKIEDARRYQRGRPEVVADILRIDEIRRREKEAGQLPFDEAE